MALKEQSATVQQKGRVKMGKVGCGESTRRFKPKAFEFRALPTTVFGQLSEANACLQVMSFRAECQGYSAYITVLRA